MTCAYCGHARELHTEILGCESETPGSTAIMDCDCLDYVEPSKAESHWGDLPTAEQYEKFGGGA